MKIKLTISSGFGDLVLPRANRTCRSAVGLNTWLDDFIYRCLISIAWSISFAIGRKAFELNPVVSFPFILICWKSYIGDTHCKSLKNGLPPRTKQRIYHIPEHWNYPHHPLNLLYFAVVAVNDIAWHNILKRKITAGDFYSFRVSNDDQMTHWPWLISFWIMLTKIFPGLSLGIVVRRYFMVNLLFLLQRGFLILIKDVLIYSNVIKLTIN